MSKELLKVTIASVPSFIELAHKSKNNLLLVSDPGTGKSTIINEMANENTKVTTFTGSSTYEESINGIPYKAEDGVQKYTQPEWLKSMIEWAEAHPNGMNILFLDEFNTADKVVMDTFKTILTERRVPTQPAGKNIPDNTVIVAAMNPQSQNAGSDFDRAHASRFMVLEISSTLDDYKNYIKGKENAMKFQLLDEPVELTDEKKMGILEQVSTQDWASFEMGDYQEINSRSMSKFFDAYKWLKNPAKDVPKLSQAFFGLPFIAMEAKEQKEEERKKKIKDMKQYPTVEELNAMTVEELEAYKEKLDEVHTAGALVCKANCLAILMKRNAEEKEGK